MIVLSIFALCHRESLKLGNWEILVMNIHLYAREIKMECSLSHTQYSRNNDALFFEKRLDTTGIREYIIPLHQEWHQNDACQPRSSTHGESLSIGLQERMRTARSKKLLGRMFAVNAS